MVSETHTGDSVYASLFEKINLNPVSALSALDNPFRSADNATGENYLQHTTCGAVRSLLQQLRVFVPGNPRVQEMVDNWQKSVRSRALPEEAMTGWNEGMIRLQQLAERPLNRQDEQRGKYMTVSELKTEVFGIMQAFNRHIPAEEQLRRYGEVRNQNGSEQQQKQAEMALNQLINRYQMIRAGKQ